MGNNTFTSGEELCLRNKCYRTFFEVKEVVQGDYERLIVKYWSLFYLFTMKMIGRNKLGEWFDWLGWWDWNIRNK